MEALSERGYRLLTTCKSKEHDTFEMFKPFRRKNGDLKYQLFFELWDFTKYGGPDWGVSITVIPESCENNVGRRDLELSVDWAFDIDRVENAAEGFYRFIRKIDRVNESKQ